jgi:hypothetical protein
LPESGGVGLGFGPPKRPPEWLVLFDVVILNLTRFWTRQSGQAQLQDLRHEAIRKARATLCATSVPKRVAVTLQFREGSRKDLASPSWKALGALTRDLFILAQRKSDPRLARWLKWKQVEANFPAGPLPSFCSGDPAPYGGEYWGKWILNRPGRKKNSAISSNKFPLPRVNTSEFEIRIL